MSSTRLMSLIGASPDEKGRAGSPSNTPPGAASVLAASVLFCSRSASAQSAMPSSSAGFSSTAIVLSLPTEVITPQTFFNPDGVLCIVCPILTLKNRYALHRELNPWLAIKFNKIARLHGQQLFNSRVCPRQFSHQGNFCRLNLLRQ